MGNSSSIPTPKLLSAPQIAGLLPAYAASVPRGEQKIGTSFTYANPHLAKVDLSQRERLLEATEKLLDVTVAFALGEMNEAALRAAEVLFHRAVARPSTVPPRNPAEYCAEKDASILDWCLTNSKTMSTAREQASRDLAAWR